MSASSSLKVEGPANTDLVTNDGNGGVMSGGGVGDKWVISFYYLFKIQILPSHIPTFIWYVVMSVCTAPLNGVWNTEGF